MERSWDLFVCSMICEMTAVDLLSIVRALNFQTQYSEGQF